MKIIIELDTGIWSYNELDSFSAMSVTGNAIMIYRSK